MIRKLSPKSVRRAAYRDLDGAVDGVVFEAVNLATDCSVYGAVYLAVQRAVNGAVFRAVLADSPHPNLDRFLVEIRQAKEGAA